MKKRPFSMKRSRRRLKLRRYASTCLALLGFATFIIIIIKQDGFIRYFQLKDTLSQLHSETLDLQNKQIALLSEIEKLKNNSYIEQLARENLGMLKSNEIFVIIDGKDINHH